MKIVQRFLPGFNHCLGRGPKSALARVQAQAYCRHPTDCDPGLGSLTCLCRWKGSGWWEPRRAGRQGGEGTPIEIAIGIGKPLIFGRIHEGHEGGKREGERESGKGEGETRGERGERGERRERNGACNWKFDNYVRTFRRSSSSL